MGQKNYVVREGFNYTTTVKNGRGDSTEKTYFEGDIVQLDPAVDTIPHQLELADEKDRAAATKAENDARKAEAAARAPAGGSLSADDLAAAIADGVARALAAIQAAQPAAPAA